LTVIVEVVIIIILLLFRIVAKTPSGKAFSAALVSSLGFE